jgi:hypothetical protein
MAYMIKHNQDGAVNGLLISLILAVLLLIGAILFGTWAFSGRQDYKKNVDAKVAVAVQAATAKEATVKDAQYAISNKLPLRTYNGPEAYGSLVIQYPKTWSAYVDDSGTGTAFVDGYFNPGTVPSINDPNSVFALRVQVVSEAYTAVVSALSNYALGTISNPKETPTTITAYSLPKVPKTVGIEASGTLLDNSVGTEVILPIRDKTLEISTDGTQFLTDFNTNILPNFSFSP